jgi:hypothetical protein
MDTPHTEGAYALVRDDKIIDVRVFDGGAPSGPDEMWLPVTRTEDSEPFIPNVTSRGFPTYRIEGDHAVRVFQIVRKAG